MGETGSVLVVDVGGSHVKVLASGESERRRAESGPSMTAAQMVQAAKELAAEWTWDSVSVGVPVLCTTVGFVADPVNLGEGWADFDFAAAFGKPTKVVNRRRDASSGVLIYGGRMLFLGLGTGLGSALVANGWVQPMELGHLPYRKSTYEDYVGTASLERRGKKRWSEHVAVVVLSTHRGARPRVRRARGRKCEAAGGVAAICAAGRQQQCVRRRLSALGPGCAGPSRRLASSTSSADFTTR